MTPETRYAQNKDGQYIGYQVFGRGTTSIVFIPDWATNLDVMWEEATNARFLDRLASFARVICFDKRGTGVSDPVPLGAVPTWEEWMFDVGTVLDAVGVERAALFGHGTAVRWRYCSPPRIPVEPKRWCWPIPTRAEAGPTIILAAYRPT